MRGLEPTVRTVRDAHSRARQGCHLVQFAETCHWQVFFFANCLSFAPKVLRGLSAFFIKKRARGLSPCNLHGAAKVTLGTITPFFCYGLRASLLTRATKVACYKSSHSHQTKIIRNILLRIIFVCTLISYFFAFHFSFVTDYF